MPPAISRPAYHPATSASLCTNKGGIFQAQPCSRLPPEQGKENAFPKSWQSPPLWCAPLSQLALGAVGEPPAHVRCGEGCCGCGQRGAWASCLSQTHPCPFPLDAEGREECELGFVGLDGAGAPRARPMARLPLPQMCRRPQEPSRACWENASAGLFCISN